MRYLAFLSILVVLLAAPQHLRAQDRSLTSLESGLTVHGWEAVGRLDIGPHGFCTGALISDRLVLTAAHCLFDSETGRRFADDTILFRAGFRNGRAASEGRVLRSVVHPDFRPARAASPDTVRNDLALLELAHPITMRGVTPFAVRPMPARGDTVGVVSYARGRLDAPSLQESCRVIDADSDGVIYMTCEVDFGASGAPVFSFTNGRAEIVSVISAKGRSDGGTYLGDLSFGVALGPKLETLRNALGARDRRFVQAPGAAPDAPRRMSAEGGARFLRP